MIDGLENLDVQVLGLRRFKWQTESKENISKTLDTNSNGSVAEVALSCLGNWVVVDIDDLVQVLDDNLADLMELLEVVATIILVDIGWEGKRSQVANSDLIRGTVLDNLGAKIGAADGTKVLLVALSVASILVKHERVSSLSLSFEDGVPKLLGLDGLATLAFLLVLLVESLELVTVNISKTRALVGAHQCPVAVLLNTLHEEIWDPQSIEEIASTNFFLSVVLSEIEELEDVSVPWFQVDGESTWALVSTLVNISGSVVEYSQHGNNAIGVSVCTSNVSTSGTNSVDVETNTSSILGDHGTSLEGVVDTVNAVLLHVDQKAGRELCLWGTGSKESWRSVCKVFARHQVVCLDSTLDVLAVNTNSYTHNHMLWALCNLAVEAQKVGSLKSLESEVLVVEVPIVDNGRVELGLVLHDTFVCCLADHGGSLLISRVHIVVEVGDDS